MANKKITELPFINTLSGSLVWDNPANNTVLPVVLRGTTNQITIENFSRFMNLYTATTGSSGNIFVGPQTINNNVTINGNQAVNGNVTISGTLRVNEIVAQYETSSILFSTGSTKLGDQITDKHEFTGSTNITGSIYYNNVLLTNIDSNVISRLFQATASLQFATASIQTYTASVNDTLSRVWQTTASLQFATASLNTFTSSARIELNSIEAYTASLKAAILPNGTNLDVFGNLRVSGSTTLGDTNTDKVEVTGSINITGYVSASGINIYSAGTPEILSTNNLKLTADSSVVITTDNSGTAKVWDFDNGGTINLPGGATISTPNTVDVIVAAGSAGAAQLANFNKGNYFAINDTLATINVDAGATNKVWQFTNVGSINLPGSIIKPDGGEYSASLTLTSSFHAFTASIGSTSNDYRIELNSIEAYTASLKSAAIVS